MDVLKDQTPDAQFRQGVFWFMFCTVPLAVAALAIGITETGCTMVDGNIIPPANITTPYPVASLENPLNLFLIVWGGASLGIGLCQLVSSFALTKNTGSVFLRVLQGFLLVIGVIFAFGSFVWSLLLRYQISPGCAADNSLWTMFMVGVVFACISGICLSIGLLCLLCAVCVRGIASVDHTTYVDRTALDTNDTNAV